MRLGLFTFVVDFYVHPSMFVGVATEAIMTGLTAEILYYLISSTIILLFFIAKKIAKKNVTQ